MAVKFHDAQRFTGERFVVNLVAGLHLALVGRDPADGRRSRSRGVGGVERIDVEMVEVPAAATRDLFEPKMDSMVVLTPAKSSAQALVLMLNGDRAGASGVI